MVQKRALSSVYISRRLLATKRTVQRFQYFNSSQAIYTYMKTVGTLRKNIDLVAKNSDTNVNLRRLSTYWFLKQNSRKLIKLELYFKEN